MAIVLKGQIIHTRGSNKLYEHIDNLDDLYVTLQKMSMAQAAKFYKVPPNSIRHRVEKYFPQEWKDTICYQREPHKNTRKGRRNNGPEVS